MAANAMPPRAMTFEEASAHVVQTQMYGGTPDSGYQKARGRTFVKLPRPRFEGAPEFYGTIPKRSSTFAWSELCVTPDPECSLSPVPQTQKMWYNTYIYVPEQHSHVERQYLERFVQGPNGEWLDVVKARRMIRYFDAQREKDIRDQIERQMLMSGAAMHNTGYTDAYSGEPLVACRGELASRETILEEHGIHRSAAELAKLMMQDARSQADVDNLRLPWPFGAPCRNKKISQQTYDWFDRNSNPYVATDRSVEIIELPSMYVDRSHHERELAGESMLHYPADEACAHQEVKYVQM